MEKSLSPILKDNNVQLLFRDQTAGLAADPGFFCGCSFSPLAVFPLDLVRV